MRLSFLAEVEVDEAELALLNLKRKRLGKQQTTAEEFVTLQLLSALDYTALLTKATVASATRTSFATAGDPDATL